jgi:hypothetical protein
MPSQIRFSLRGAFAAIALVAVVLSLWISYRAADENKRLRAENTRLRNESGELTIEPGNEDKVHAIKVATLDAYTWRWRIYAPKGRPIALRIVSERILADGKSYGNGESAFGLSPGETLITLGLRRSPKGQWEWVVQEAHDSGGGETRGGITLNADNVEPLIDKNTSSASGVYQTTSTAEPGHDLELLGFKMSSASAGGINEQITVTIHDGSP